MYAQRYNAAGLVQGAEFRVNTYTTGSQSAPAVAMDANGDFAVAWRSDGQDGDVAGIYAQRYNAAGVAQGGEFDVNTYTTASQSTPAVAMDSDGDFLITWHSDGQDGNSWGVYARRYDAAGVAQGSDFRVNSFTTDLQVDSSVAMDANGDFVVAWASFAQDGSAYGVYAQCFNAAAVAQGSEFRLNTYTTGIQLAPAVAMDADGDFVAVWQSDGQDGSGYGIYAQRYDESTDTAGPIVTGVFAGGAAILAGATLDTAPTQLVVAFSEDLSVAGGSGGANSVTNPANWSLQHTFGDVTGQITGITFAFNAVTNRYEATLTLTGPLAGGGYVLTAKQAIQDLAGNALDGNLDGAPGGDSSLSFGVAAVPEFRVNTTTLGTQDIPALAMDADGDFVAVWQSFDGDGAGIYGQRYNAAGVPQGSEFRVNTYLTGDQREAAVAMNAAGDFVVAWQSNGQDGSGYGVYAQRYNAAGVAQGSEFRVNTYTAIHQRTPTVDMDADGDFVVAWQSYQDGSSYGIYAQRYNAAGVAQGSEFRVNTETNSGQRNPVVAMDTDGDFVVAWESGNQDASGYGIYAQSYNATGVAQGTEFLVNTYTTGGQDAPSLAMDADGDFVVAWRSNGQDGSGYCPPSRNDCRFNRVNP